MAKAWDVYETSEDLRPMDTVFYDSNCDADYVWRGLIAHDGYPSTIVVECEEDGIRYPVD